MHNQAVDAMHMIELAGADWMEIVRGQQAPILLPTP